MSPRALHPEDAGEIAALHALAFAAPWSAREFAELLAIPGVFGLYDPPRAFVLCRSGGGEAEVLTIATDPAHRRQGAGRALLESAMAIALASQAETVFLEVAAGNDAAVGLYQSLGFERVGLRRGYYASGEDALVMRRALNRPANPPYDLS